jgi:uncharacterized membrane protein
MIANSAQKLFSCASKYRMERSPSTVMYLRRSIQFSVRIGAMRVALWALLAIAAIVVSKPVLGAGVFSPLGFFGGDSSTATDVSGDGSAVVGVTSGSAIGLSVFRWTAAGTIMRTSTSFDSDPAISANGSAVVGVNFSLSGFEAYRWIPEGSFDLLGDLAGGALNSAAVDVSADGSLIVGYGTPSTPNQPFPTGWSGTNGGTRLPGLGIGSAFGVSADGATIVGRADSHAFRLRDGVASDLGLLPGANSSVARRVSANGDVVVGGNDFPRAPSEPMNLHSEAFRWTQTNGMESLGDLPGGRVLSTAYDVSADGSVIVGVGETSFDGTFGTSEAFYWTPQTGMLNLRDVLISAGATGLDDWTLTEARGVSYDGLTIVGTGVHGGITEAWVATIPEPPTVLLFAAALAGVTVFGVKRRNYSKLK